MKIKIYPIFFVLLLFVSCTVYREYPIDVYRPGEANVPPSAKNAAVIFRNFNYEGDTLQHYYKDDFQLVKAKNDPKNLDSMLVTAVTRELAADLKSNKVFNEVHVLPWNTFEKHTGSHLANLPPELVEKVANASNADLLIVLETYSSFFSTYPQTFDTPKTNEVITVAVWGIYDPVKKVNLERKSMIDTVFWNGYDDEGNSRRGYTPPPRLAALEMASALAGENYAKRFYATWETVNRMYSVPPLPEFSEAAYYFEEGKWDQAIALWQKYADDSNGKMAINARYNLALAYELKDDLDTAQQWLTAALELASKYKSRNELNSIRTYQKILNTRRKELSKLNRQQNENLQ